MTAYPNKSFSVARGRRDPKDCPHGWVRENGECVWCGAWVLNMEGMRDWARPEILDYVRFLRHAGYSLRDVALAVHMNFGGFWTPRSNQLAGADLCGLAGVPDDAVVANQPDLS